MVEDIAHDEMLAMHAFRKHNRADKVQVVWDGADAFDFVFCTGALAGRHFENPRGILLDNKLPVVDGMEVLRQVREDPRTRMIPVVMLTSSTEEIDTRDSNRLGVNGYIVKPADFDEFSEIARRLGCYWLRINQQPVESC